MMLDGPLPTMPEGNSVLVVMAHPDDAEFGCGGTIAKWAAAGKEINYVLCTSGDKGSGDPDISPYRLAQTRRSEQINAAHALGAKDVLQADPPLPGQSPLEGSAREEWLETLRHLGLFWGRALAGVVAE